MHLAIDEGLGHAQDIKALGADVGRLAFEPEALNERRQVWLMLRFAMADAVAFGGFARSCILHQATQWILVSRKWIHRDAEWELQHAVDNGWVDGDQLVAYSGLNLVDVRIDNGGIDKLLNQRHAWCTFGVVLVERYELLHADRPNEFCLIKVCGRVLSPLPN